MTKIDIINLKLIMIINSFGYILSGFQHFYIFLMKNGYCHSSGKKYAKMVLLGLKTHFKKFFLGYFYPQTLPMQKIESKWSLNRFLQCPFQRPLLVGLMLQILPKLTVYCLLRFDILKHSQNLQVANIVHFSSFLLNK